MEEAKKVANENFDWNAFENDLGVYDQPKEQIGEAYDKTLSNIAARARVSSPFRSSVTTRI